ncbi:YlxM family DNA-binding protein [Cohnella thermotolerans]|uniref:YlxM family DNA-binding protein n=1 Tax=Cohnella thermotolerans TaxID=329858 RepID=UPI00040588BC|nr:YlxM family DNA-binding protein [Cohnella thermotolerans]
MHGENALEKTNRINVLFDFYGSLLTEKQQMFLKCYYHDDYSLSEIADDFDISRQAVYEHLKRSEQILEDYEKKLGLAARHERLRAGLMRLEQQIGELPDPWREKLRSTADLIRGAEAGYTPEGAAGN